MNNALIALQGYPTNNVVHSFRRIGLVQTDAESSHNVKKVDKLVGAT